MTAITAANANRSFSAVLRHVRRGASYVVTSHGKPVARIVPIREDDAPRRAAKAALLTRLRVSKPTKVGRWTRDELYDL